MTASLELQVFLHFNAWISFPFQVDINGHFTFSDQRVGSQFAPRPLESVSTPRVAPFWIDLNAGIRGKVYYQVLSSTMDDGQATLASISQLSSAVLLPDISFNVKWALLVTWDHVAYFGDRSTVRNWNIIYDLSCAYWLLLIPVKYYHTFKLLPFNYMYR